MRLFAVALAVVAVAVGSPPASAAPPDLDARSWSLVDARTGQTLASKAAARRLPMASTTKMMTAYLTLRRLPMNQLVTTIEYQAIPGESLMGFAAGERISVRDLLYGLILLSGNDSAVVLAEAVSGSQGRFVALMNRTARRLGLRNTSYENPIGLDAEGQYSSAADLSRLGRILMEDARFRRIASARSATLRSYRPPVEIETTNEFVADNAWARGIKTGRTIRAGFVLTSDGRQRATELIATVMGTPSEAARDAETVELMEWGFSLYEERVPIRPAKPVATVPVRFEDRDLGLFARRSVRIGVRDGERLTVARDVPDEVEGPVDRGDRVGVATVRLDGEAIATVPLFAARNLAEPGFVERFEETVSENPIYIVLAGFVILGVLVLIRRRQTRRMRNKLRRVGKRQR